MRKCPVCRQMSLPLSREGSLGTACQNPECRVVVDPGETMVLGFWTVGYGSFLEWREPKPVSAVEVAA